MSVTAYFANATEMTCVLRPPPGAFLIPRPTGVVDDSAVRTEEITGPLKRTLQKCVAQLPSAVPHVISANIVSFLSGID